MSPVTVIDTVACPGPTSSRVIPSPRLARSEAHLASVEVGQQRLEGHPRLGVVERRIVVAQVVAEPLVGVAGGRVERARSEAPVGRQRLDAQVELEAAPLGELAGARGPPELLAQV